MNATTTPATTTANEAPRKARKVERTPLKTICGQLKIDPKAARRKLRKAGFTWHGSRERWTMTEAQATKVREILKESDIERTKPAKAKAAAKPASKRVAKAPAEAAQPSA